MMGKGQVKRLDGRDAVGQAKFVAGLFGALRNRRRARHACASTQFSQPNPVSCHWAADLRPRPELFN